MAFVSAMDRGGVKPGLAESLLRLGLIDRSTRWLENRLSRVAHRQQSEYRALNKFTQNQLAEQGPYAQSVKRAKLSYTQDWDVLTI